jgi:hypothetical protein
MWTVALALALAAAPALADETAEAEAEATYKMGLDLLSQGRYDDACRLFRDVAGTDTSYAEKARKQMSVAAVVGGGEACAEATAEPEPAPRPRAGRKLKDDGTLELTISQALVGPGLLGGLVPATLGVQAPAVYLAGGLVGLGVGIASPLAIAHRYGVTEGQAMVVSTGEAIGTWNGVFLAASIPSLWEEPRGAAGIVTAGLLLGLGAGAATAITVKPTAGDVALVRSGFTWGAYVGGVSFLFAPNFDSAASVFVRLGALADGGAAVGALLATQFEISRARMNVINLSGYAGALGLALLYGIGALAADGGSEVVLGGVLSVGAVGGIVVGTILTRDMDEDRVAWLGVGGALGLDRGRVVAGLPVPSPRWAPDGSIGVEVTLASGRF